jgi:hypothetical protein
LQLNASSPSRKGTAGSDRAVTTFDRSRPSQIEGPSDQLGCRGSDREANAHARNGEWIVPASKGQHALAATDPDDEPALREYDGDPAGFGPRWRAETSHAREQSNQGDAHAKLFHDFLPLKRRHATPAGQGAWRNPIHGEQNARYVACRPPVNAFWSITMDDLVPNPISRDDMRLNCDGSLTIDVR